MDHYLYAVSLNSTKKKVDVGGSGKRKSEEDTLVVRAKDSEAHSEENSTKKNMNDERRSPKNPNPNYQTMLTLKQNHEQLDLHPFFCLKPNEFPLGTPLSACFF